MSNTAIPSYGYGGTVSRSKASNDNTEFERIMYIFTMPNFQFNKGTVEVTHTKSPGLYREYIPDEMKDNPAITITVFDSPAESSHQSIYDDWRTNWQYQQGHYYRIEEPNGDVLVEFQGFVTNISMMREVNSAKVRDITIQPTGEPSVINL